MWAIFLNVQAMNMRKLVEKLKLEKSDYREWERKISRKTINSKFKIVSDEQFLWLVKIQIWELSITNWVQSKPILLFLIEENYINISNINMCLFFMDILTLTLAKLLFGIKSTIYIYIYVCVSVYF